MKHIKNILSALLALAMILTLAACAGGGQTSGTVAGTESRIENTTAPSGKTLIPFSTHEGSGLSGFDKKLASAIPGATVGKGLAVRGNDAQNRQDSVRNSVNDWLNDLGL